MKRILFHLFLFVVSYPGFSQIKQNNALLFQGGYVAHTNMGGLHYTLLYQRHLDRDFSLEVFAEYAFHSKYLTAKDMYNVGNTFYSWYLGFHGLYYPLARRESWNIYLGLGGGIIFPYLKWFKSVSLGEEPSYYIITDKDGMVSGLAGIDLKIYQNWYAGGRIILNFAFSEIPSYNTLTLYVKYSF